MVIAETKTELLKPPLKWAGGKRWLVPTLEKHWQLFLKQHKTARQKEKARLVEPFCGGLSIALGLNPERALLNDVNPHVIAFYQNLQQGLILNPDKTLLLNDSETYYRNREKFNSLITPHPNPPPQGGREQVQTLTQEASALFYYLNRTGYNGLCRFNQKGLFNVPFGRYKTINYQLDFTSYQEVLMPWQFTCRDFEQLQTTEHDFIYVDPPYDVPFVSYAQNGFNWEDQVRLVKWLTEQPGKIIVSNQATDRIINLYKDHGFKVDVIDAPRRIACNGNREKAKEILARLY